MDAIESFFEALSAQPLWKYYLLCALVAFLVLVLVWNRCKQPSRMLAFTTERGKVYISRRAISEMITKVAARTPGVEKCRNRLKERDAKLHIMLRIHMRADADLREIERRLEVQITDVLNRNLGFNSIGSFTTKAAAIDGELAPEARTVTRAGLKSEAEFPAKAVNTNADTPKSSIFGA
jgi:hypothetical protein